MTWAFWTSVAFAALMVPPGVLSPTPGPPPPGASPESPDALEEAEGDAVDDCDCDCDCDCVGEPEAEPDPCCVTHNAAVVSSGDISTMT